jgi:excisionase family DNA binding protein
MFCTVYLAHKLDKGEKGLRREDQRTGNAVQKAKDFDMADREELTLSVPEAASRYFGLGKNAAYAAAARGEIPTIKIGRLLRVPVRALEQMLDRAGERPA